MRLESIVAIGLLVLGWLCQGPAWAGETSHRTPDGKLMVLCPIDGKDPATAQ